MAIAEHANIGDPEDSDADNIVDLDEWLAEPLDDELLDSEPTAPEDDAIADRWLRRLARLTAQGERDLRVAALEHDRIEGWLVQRNERREREMRWITGALEGFMRAANRMTRAKTLDLPNGRLKLRAPSTRTIIVDEDTFVAWATDNAPDLLVTKVAPIKSAIKAQGRAVGFGPSTGSMDLTSQVAIHGEIVPGVAFEQAPQDTFGVEL